MEKHGGLKDRRGMVVEMNSRVVAAMGAGRTGLVPSVAGAALKHYVSPEEHMVFACDRWWLDPIVVYIRSCCGSLNGCIFNPATSSKMLLPRG